MNQPSVYQQTQTLFCLFGATFDCRNYSVVYLRDISRGHQIVFREKEGEEMSRLNFIY